MELWEKVTEKCSKKIVIASPSLILSCYICISPPPFPLFLLTLPPLTLNPFPSHLRFPTLTSPQISLPSLSPLSPLSLPLSPASGTQHHPSDHGNGSKYEDPPFTKLAHSKSWNSLEDLLREEEEDSDLYIVKHDEAGQLSIKKGDKLKVLQKSENGDWCEVTNVKGEVGWTPTSYIAMLENLKAKPWFHGNITWAEAELLLGSGINGSFLVRESESKPGQFSISLRYDGLTVHYHIFTDAERKFYVFSESKFETVSELVVHHSKEPDGLTTTLRYPARNPRKLPIYSTPHEPDQWEINRLDIDIGQKLHEGKNTVPFSKFEE